MNASVGLFSVGYGAPDARTVAKLLNGTVGPYAFERSADLTNLGKADLFGYAYGDNAFTALVAPHRSRYHKCAILTAVPIQDNFFTRAVGDDLIISTTHQAEEMLAESHRSAEDYAAIAITQELVSFEFQRVTGRPWHELFHDDPRGCIFDFAGVKSQKIAKLTKCSICDGCLGKLSNGNVDLRIVDFAKRVLRRIRRPSLLAALRLSLTAPLLSFAYGGVVVGAAVNLFSSLALNNGALTRVQLQVIVASGLAVVLFPLAVFGALFFAELHRRLR